MYGLSQQGHNLGGWVRFRTHLMWFAEPHLEHISRFPDSGDEQYEQEEVWYKVHSSLARESSVNFQIEAEVDDDNNL